MSSLNLLDYYVSCLRFGLIWLAGNVLREAMESNQDPFLSAIMIKDKMELDGYVAKMRLLIEIYQMDLKLADFQPEYLEYLLGNKEGINLYEVAMEQIVKEIRQRNLVKVAQYDQQDRL